jgi:hypothetical protein
MTISGSQILNFSKASHCLKNNEDSSNSTDVTSCPVNETEAKSLLEFNNVNKCLL